MTGSFELKYAWVLGIGSHPIYRRQPAPKELLQNKIKVRHKLVLFCLFLSVSYTWPTGIGTMILWSPCGPKHVTEYWPVTLSNIRKKGGFLQLWGHDSQPQPEGTMLLPALSYSISDTCPRELNNLYITSYDDSMNLIWFQASLKSHWPLPWKACEIPMTCGWDKNKITVFLLSAFVDLLIAVSLGWRGLFFSKQREREMTEGSKSIFLSRYATDERYQRNIYMNGDICCLRMFKDPIQ